MTFYYKTLKHKLLIALILASIITSCSKDSSAIPLDGMTVEITSPQNLTTLTPGSVVKFRGKTSIPSGEYNGLTAIWESDIDGILQQGKLSDFGESSFETSNLSQNIHHIKFNIRNSDGEVIFDEIRVYNALKLYPIEGQNNGSIVSWSKASINDFGTYHLFRSHDKNSLSIESDTPIYSTNSIQDTVYIDSTATLGVNFFYKAYVERKTLAPAYVGSNIDSITPGEFIELDFPIYKIISDPTRNYAYGIVNLESIYYNNDTGYGLVFINTNTKTVEKRISTNIRFTDLDIDHEGSNLYLCSRTTAIHRVNLNTRELEEIFYVSNPAHKLEIGQNGRMYYHITPPTSGSTEFRMYNLYEKTDIPYNSTITDAYSSFRHGDFELDGDHTIFHGESNSSSSNLSKIGTENDTFSLIKQYDSKDYQTDRLILNNDRLFWNHLLFDKDLNKLGEFLDVNQDINIQAVSPNGDYALGWSNIFISDNQSIKKKIPVFYDTATFIDNSRLLLIKNDNTISSQYKSRVFFYNL